MSNQKHTVATDALETLGTIIDERAGRDAIHLAVEPVIAGESLNAGQEIHIEDGVALLSHSHGQGIGIVDPFLTSTVRAGQRFWLVVKPRTITSLRHVWSHPAFPEAAQETQAIVSTAIEASKAWIKEWLDTVDSGGLSVDEFLEVIDGGRVSMSDKDDDYDWMTAQLEGEYILIRGADAHGSIPAEVWPHVENVIGHSPVNRPEFFSCAC